MFFQPNDQISGINPFTRYLKLFYISRRCGGVAERLKATVLKTVVGRPTVSSNLTSSANLNSTKFFLSQATSIYISVFQRIFTQSYSTRFYHNQHMHAHRFVYSNFIHKERYPHYLYGGMRRAYIPLTELEIRHAKPQDKPYSKSDGTACPYL